VSSTDIFVANAGRYAEAFGKGDLPSPPASRTAVLACMDARVNPYGLLGLAEGDAHVLRNAGGVVTEDVIRSLTISQSPFIPHKDSVRGFVYEVATGRLREVE
jgi:carbonic anhydrase